MKKKIIATVLALSCVLANVVFAISASAATVGATYFVAQDGKDENPGTIDAPFATIEKARDSIRELKKSSGLPDGGVTVYVKDGTYKVDNAIEFTQEDSGTEKSPIVYKAFGDKKPQIVGGVILDGGSFKRITKNDSNYERLQTSQAKKNVRTIDLNDYLTPEEYSGKFLVGENECPAWSVGGRGTDKALPGVEVFYNGKALEAARWPNSENGEDKFTQFGEKVTEAVGRFPEKGPVLKYTDARITKWKTTDNATIIGVNEYWSENSSFKIDQTANTIALDYGGEYTYHWGSNYNYYYKNVFEELDQEGEYYIDAESGILYIYCGDEIKDAEVRIDTFGKTFTDALIKFNKASNITLSGFEISLSRAHGIHVFSGSDVNVINCDISDVGLNGIIDDNLKISGLNSTTLRGMGYGFYKVDCGKEAYQRDAGYNHNYINNHIFNTGIRGINIHAGDRIDLDPANHVISNCEINSTGRFDTSYGQGIEAIGVGIAIRNNEIHDIPFSAIVFGLNDGLIEYNEFYDCMKYGADMGVLYSSAYCAEINAGTQIRYNYFHDVSKKASGSVGMSDNSLGDAGDVTWRIGIYNDNAQPFLEVNHNVFADMPIGGFLTGGWENNWKDNIFINVDKPMWVAYNHILAETVSKNGPEAVFDTRISTREYEAMDNAVWREKYPEVFVAKDKIKELGIEAACTQEDVKGNYSVFNDNTEKLSEQLAESTVNTKNLRTENNTFTKSIAGFTDIQNGDYTFTDNSELFNINPEFKSIDIKKMGKDKSKTAEIVNGSVVLKIGTPNAIIFGKSKMVDGQNPDVQPVITDSRTLVPARFISESFGGEVTWNGDTREVGINLNGTEIKMTLDKAEYTINGGAKTLDVPAQSVNGRTLVPLRALVEALGKDVFWDERGLIVISNEKGLIEKENDKETIDYLVKYTPAY